MDRSRWLNRFAILTAFCTLLLIGLGGLVTSHGVGMAVPDWPTTYGYNMFLFPISQWVGGIFYEHTHRLVASFVGFLTTILALWLFGVKSRPVLRWGGAALLLLAFAGVISGKLKPGTPLLLAGVGMVAAGASFVWPRCQPAEAWLRRLGVLAFAGVVFQGVLGGLRVVLFKDQIGIFHATLAQMFLVLVSALALFTSGWWKNLRLERDEKPVGSGLRALLALATLLILTQLVLGATMRHQHAGLAVPDFPLAYGKLWPPTDGAALELINQKRLDVSGYNPITASQILLHMAHRIGALVTLLTVAFVVWKSRREVFASRWPARLALAWLGMICLQALLGAVTLWSNKAADVATAHVVLGAASLVAGSLLTLCACRLRSLVETPCAEPVSATVAAVSGSKSFLTAA